ncbi:MAG: hypothetical protein JW384_00300 [Nitrosomonadaceae bacterium]|nr:hypothetical protein [Nitrosomonadaceae bacterium]
MSFGVTKAILRLASIGHVQLLRDSVRPPPSTIRFGWEGGVGEFDCTPVSDEPSQALAENHFHSAIEFLQSRVPFMIRRVGDGPLSAPIVEAELGQVLEPRKMLSASSPEAPGVIRFAAHWSSFELPRGAALILHESVHQLLYAKEAAASPVRLKSLAYSPWKQTIRPGRLVWHAYWTFAVQVGFLLELANQIPQVEVRVGELAAMFARLEKCKESLTDFKILNDEEELRVVEGMKILRELTDKFSEEFQVPFNVERELVSDEHNRWAASVIAADTRSSSI